MCDKEIMGLRGGKRRRLEKITRGGTARFFVQCVVLSGDQKMGDACGAYGRQIN
jgi:hypothetical protein